MKQKPIQWIPQCLGCALQHAVQIVFCVLLVCVLLLVLFILPVWDGYDGLLVNLVDKDKEKVIKHFGFVISGLLLLGGILIANRRAKAMEETVRQAELGHQQERFRDAITHLGSESTSVRLGGIYGLYHLALENEDKRKEIIRIFYADIRSRIWGDEYREQNKFRPSEDIQTMLDLLFRDKQPLFKYQLDGDVDFSGAYLQGADLQGAQLQGADLRRAQLQGADLQGAQLQKVLLLKAQMQGADLEGAQMQGADLLKARMQGADLGGAQMQGANLQGAQMQGVYLQEAQMQGVYLNRADLQGADLEGAQMQGADLEGAQLQGADLSLAGLQGAILLETQLQGISSISSLGFFETQIESRIGQRANWSNIIFSGGLTDDEVDRMTSIFLDSNRSRAETFKEKMQPHIGREPSYDLPENSGAVLGVYTKEEADKWIEEYKKATDLSLSI